MDELLRGLLIRCIARDDEAIAAVIKRFQPWALDMSASMLDDRDLAEDAVQNAFLTAFEHLSDLREIDAFAGWFRQIVRTCTLRAARSHRETPMGDEIAERCESDSLEESVERSELRRYVREALQSLTPVRRETAEMFYFQELSCAEIADALRVPEGTVKRRLYDSREQLRSMLLGYIGDASPREKKPKDRGLPL